MTEKQFMNYSFGLYNRASLGENPWYIFTEFKIRFFQSEFYEPKTMGFFPCSNVIFN